MNGKLKIAIAVFITASIFTFLQLRIVCLIGSFFYPIGVRSAESITKVFYDNQNYFEEVVDIALSDENSGNIYINSVKHFSYWGFLTPYKYDINDTRNCSQTKKDFIKEKLECSNIKYIFGKLDFMSINISEDEISFTDRATRSFISGITYLKDGITDYNEKYYKYTHLTGNWYYFTSK